MTKIWPGRTGVHALRSKRLSGSVVDRSSTGRAGSADLKPLIDAGQMVEVLARQTSGEEEREGVSYLQVSS